MGLGQRRGSGMAMVDDHALDVDLDSSITGGIRGTKMRVISRRCIWAMVESSLMVLGLCWGGGEPADWPWSMTVFQRNE